MKTLFFILKYNYRILSILAVATLLIGIGTIPSVSKDLASPASEVYTDSARIHFRISSTDLDPQFKNNGVVLGRMLDSLNRYAQNDTLYKLRAVKVVGAASPEGPVTFNSMLSEKRAGRIFDYFTNALNMPDSITDFTYKGRDWAGLRALVEQNNEVPYRAEVLSLLDAYLYGGKLTKENSDRLLGDLKYMRGGASYRYLLKNEFPKLRASDLFVMFERTPQPAVAVEPAQPTVEEDIVMTVIEIVEADENSIAVPEVPAIVASEGKPFYMALKSNMLHDVLALPNIGAEFYIGKNFSIGANWTYGWWDSDRRHRYWRAYGGDINARWWFGKRAAEKPLTGHHVGVYGGVLTYDFEWGGTGYMGGRPGHSLWDRCLMNAGVEYGYSLPVGRRLNIDFTIGFGYVGGLVEKYTPINGYYFWESTSRKTWIGPSKVDVSLVWLIGNGNYNVKKGGSR